MDFTTLKYWHWMIIGVVLGSVVGYAWTGMPHDMPRSADAEVFKRMLGHNGGRQATKDLPMIKNITVLAPETDPHGMLVYPVTFDFLGTSKGQPVYQRQGIYALTPFDGNDTVVGFLKNRKASFADRSAGVGMYTPVGYGAGIGLLSIGLVFPTMIALLVGAGLAAPKPHVEKPVRKHATGKQDDGTIKHKKRGVTDGDVNQLNALNDLLESSVAKGLSAREGHAAPAAAAAEPVSVLMSGGGSKNATDPTVAAVPRTPEEEKEYAGQWYPVARPHKKDGEHHHG